MAPTAPDWITAISTAVAAVATAVAAVATIIIACFTIRSFPEKVVSAMRSTDHLPRPVRDDPFMLKIYNILTKKNLHIEYDRYGADQRSLAADSIVPLPYHKLPPTFATIRYAGGWVTKTTKENTYEIDCYSPLPDSTLDIAEKIRKVLTDNDIPNEYRPDPEFHKRRLDEPLPTRVIEKHHVVTIWADSPTLHRDT